MTDVRRDKRLKSNLPYVLCWEEAGLTRSIAVKASDVSLTGVGLRCTVEIATGTRVYIEAENSSQKGYGVVRHCTRSENGHILGVDLHDETHPLRPVKVISNYYELLQISANAEISTIERIYRFLAARYHPDNPRTGDSEAFISVTRAYKVLSDPASRSAYDAELLTHAPGQSTLFQSIDFMDGLEGEVNRRVAVLALLYHKCRTTPDNPRVSLAELESRMGFPREYLDFTTWYLKSKKYINREDNSDFSLTALGVDYVEENYTKSPILTQLLGTGEKPASAYGKDPGDAGLGVHRGLELGPARENDLREVDHQKSDCDGKEP